MNQLGQLLLSLAGVPALPGARCRGRHHLFDPAERNEDAEPRHLQALGLCQHCPALQRCQEWVDSLPARQRPKGVVAGRQYFVKGGVR